MSTPAALKVGPFTTNLLVKKRYILFYLFLFWISFFFVQFEFWIYYNLLFDMLLYFILFLPFLIILMYISIVLISLFFAKILLMFVNLLHKPREGVFLRDEDDKDYRYWNLRHTIKKWPVWLSHKFPFPFMDNICLKVFNVKTTFSNSLFEGWVDTEFIEFGQNVIVGQGSIIQSAVIAGNLFIIRKTSIGDNTIIGAHSIVMPGSHIGKNCMLTSSSTTIVGQELEDGFIYSGVPAKKFKKNRFFEEDIKPFLNNPEKIEFFIDKYNISQD
jgi:acetyltransferase-like isoleucine patch superfamily enzyme